MNIEHDTVVIGGGQAGLAVGHFLAERGVDFTILEGDARVGDVWRRRWDSLHLHSPAGVSALPGLAFPAPARSFPSKDAVADYLEAYAAHFRLPVQTATRVRRVTAHGDGYRILAGDRTLQARHVVIATGAFQRPSTPAFAHELAPSIVQVHASAYRNPSELPDGDVLVVGGGNSGAEIGFELARAGRGVYWSGRDTGRIPARTLTRIFGLRLYWWVLSTVMSVRSPIGRRVRPKLLARGAPLIGVGRKQVLATGVRAVPRTDGVADGRPRLADGRVLDVASVVWATGYRPAFDWIDLPIFDETGQPRHDGGAIADAPGLYFVGLFFQTALTSSLLGGVGVDARRIAAQIASRAGARSAAPRQVVGGVSPAGGVGARASSR